MAIYTLKNRFSGKPYVGQFDGTEYIIVDTLSVPDYVALHLRNHAIVRDNPITGEREYSLGILELKDDVSPLAELPVETLDRSDMDFPKATIMRTTQRTPRPEPRGSGRGVPTLTAKERG